MNIIKIMKKNIYFLIIFIFFIIVFEASSRMMLKKETIGKNLIDMVIPIIKIIKREGEKTSLLSYINILKSKIVKEDVFIELPEDSVELIPENITEEKIIEEKDENKDNIKQVTLDWSKVLKNETKYTVSIEKMLKENLKFQLKNSGTEVIIYHTHTTESYTESKDYKYIPSGEFRTKNFSANVTAIGEHLANFLRSKDVGVYHDKTIYDEPYNLSYSKAGKGIVANTKKYNKAQVVLDIHRDAIGTSTEVYRPVTYINDKASAQILLVVGTNQGGLKHSNWRENLKFALKIKDISDKKYPGLCRYIVLRKERFNQHVTKGAIIVEMGATGNTMEEAMYATDLFGEVLLETIQK